MSNSSHFILMILFVSGITFGCSEKTDPRVFHYIDQTYEAIDKGAFNAALALSDSALAYGEQHADTYFLQGRIYTELARFELADTAYQRAIELDPTMQGAWLNRGNIAIRKGDAQKALSHYLEEEKRHPTSNVYLQLGRAYSQLGEGENAESAFLQAIELDSTRATLYMRLGELYREQGEMEKAIEYTKKGVNIDPENSGYYYALGSLLNSAGESEEAISYLKPFADENPWHYWSHYNLGQAYQRMGNEEASAFYLTRADSLQEVQTEIDHWQGMAESNPQHFMLWLRFIHALRKAGNSKDAERAERIMYALSPEYLIGGFSDAEVNQQHNVALLKLSGGEIEEAIEIYRGLLRQYPDNPALWLNLGVSYAAYGRIVQARQSWEVATRYNRNFARAHRYIQDLDMAFYNPDSPGNS